MIYYGFESGDKFSYYVEPGDDHPFPVGQKIFGRIFTFNYPNVVVKWMYPEGGKEEIPIEFLENCTKE